MSERENILTRAREALTIPVDGNGGGLPTVADQRRVLPAVSRQFNEQLALFQKHATELRAHFQVVDDAIELICHLRFLKDTEAWKKVATHNSELSRSAVSSLDLPVLLTDKDFDRQELARCDAGISECDALIAQTGTVLLTSRSSGGRALSALPPHHVVIAQREQLVSDLPAAFELLQQKYERNYPSMISFITGPSRTGDIERILVLGAHGPRKLTIFMI